VRTWLSWLLALGVIAGLCGRVLALDHVHHDGVEHCCDHDHGHPPTDDHSHEGYPPGPHEHHHSHACCHPSPLGTVENRPQRFFLPLGGYVRVVRVVVLPPGEPVFALDKPPLN